MQRAVSCVTRAALITSSAGYEGDREVHALTLGAIAVPLSGRNRLGLLVRICYQIVQAEPMAAEWFAAPTGYTRAIEDGGGHETVAWHWHPRARGQIEEPHRHLGAGSGASAELAKRHLPTGRLALSGVVRYLIRDLGVRPLRADWEQALATVEAAAANR
ncbi:MAG TPA: hypothetical protein VFD32_16750 [Dehalococcoidia bacterium]|nr:hypothetical protein [Dehalococcoidia bacterium]